VDEAVKEVKCGMWTYRRVMADLLCGEDEITCGFVSSPLGEILLPKDGIIRFLFHARGGGPRRVGSIES
jgi:hypothetical protein